MIPGSEFAPALDIGMRPSSLGDWERVERRLSCSDPDDMRAIWRRAALALGATEEEALHYVLAHHYDRYYRLTRPERWSEGNRNIGTEFWGDDIVQATAALCRAVWGPK